MNQVRGRGRGRGRGYLNPHLHAYNIPHCGYPFPPPVPHHFDNGRRNDHSSKRKDRDRDHSRSGSRGRDYQHRNNNQHSNYGERGRGGSRDSIGERGGSNDPQRDRSGSSRSSSREPYAQHGSNSAMNRKGSKERTQNNSKNNHNRPRKNIIEPKRDLKRSKFPDNESNYGERSKKLPKVDSPPDNKEKLDESSEQMKKDIEKNLKKTSSPRVSTTTPLIRAARSIDDSEKQTFVKVDKTRVLEIPFTKDDYANIGQGKLSSPSRNLSGDENEMTVLSVESATPIRKNNVSICKKNGENAKVSNTDYNNKKSGSSLVISNSSKFKDSLSKMDPKSLKELADNPAQVKLQFRKKLQKLIEEHKVKISRKLDQNTINSLRESGFCGNDNDVSLENLSMDTCDDSVLILISDWVKKEIPDIDSITAIPERNSNPDSSQFPDEQPEPAPILLEDSVDMVIKCEPSDLNFDLSADIIETDEASSTKENEDNEIIKSSEVSVPTVNSENVETSKADNDSLAFAPPNTKRKRGKPKKGQGRIIGGTETIIGPIIQNQPLPTVSATPQKTDHSSSNSSRDLLPSSTVVTPPPSKTSNDQSAVPTGLAGLSSLSVTRVSAPAPAPTHAPYCPIDPNSCTSDDVNKCLRDIKQDFDGDTHANENIFLKHFLDTSQQRVLQGTDSNPVLNSGAYQSNPGPSPGKQAVEDIHALKLKSLKDIFKRESKATQEIQGLDKEIDKLIKERKGKLAELKKIQKEKMNILDA